MCIPTVRNWICAGKLNTVRTAGGEHRNPESEIRWVLGVPIQIRKTVLYSRVSTQERKKDLEIQEQLLEHHAIENGYRNIVKLRDIASGLNEKRLGYNRLFRMISNNEIDTVIVNYKDRLTRFGFKYLETYFNSHGAIIVVLNH